MNAVGPHSFEVALAKMSRREFASFRGLSRWHGNSMGNTETLETVLPPDERTDLFDNMINDHLFPAAAMLA